MKRQLLVIKKGGDILGVYHDENRELYDRLGKGRTQRASDVEAIEGEDGRELFQATIRLDGAVLPPHPSRNAVIEQEVTYIEQNILQNLTPQKGLQ